MSKTKLDVYYIDAWADCENSWTYNDMWFVKELTIKGEPTKRKLVNALVRNELLKPGIKCEMEECSFDPPIFSIMRADDMMPMYDFHWKQERSVQR